jgi:hypothetical protein
LFGQVFIKGKEQERTKTALGLVSTTNHVFIQDDFMEEILR